MSLVVVLFVVQFNLICMYVVGYMEARKGLLSSLELGAYETYYTGRYWDTNSEVSRSASTMV